MSPRRINCIRVTGVGGANHKQASVLYLDFTELIEPVSALTDVPRIPKLEDAIPQGIQGVEVEVRGPVYLGPRPQRYSVSQGMLVSRGDMTFPGTGWCSP